ncbi:hypothetical protein ZK16_25350, partial [Salmonella enterica subsp. enterica serovar Enteritidis]|nr:hypothetical protein [Salmonella enterica subsp. enterica serovar Enteritidis]
MNSAVIPRCFLSITGGVEMKKNSDEYQRWQITQADKREKESYQRSFQKWKSIIFQSVFIGVLALC